MKILFFPFKVTLKNNLFTQYELLAIINEITRILRSFQNFIKIALKDPLG